MAKINYSKGGEGGGFELLPQGTYDFTVKSAVQKESKNGNPQIEVSLEVVDGPAAGKTMKVWYSLLPQATWKWERLLEACGVTGVDTGQVDASGEPVLETDSDDLIGCFFRAEVKHRKYDGKDRSEIADEGPSRFSAKAPAAAGQAAAPPASAPATPSSQGAPVQGRRPRPAPAS